MPTATGWGWLVLAAVAAAAAAADQYEQQATRLQHHRFNIPQHSELQVGCADGAVHHDHDHHDGPVLQVLKRLKRQAEQTRHRRDYIQWFGSSTTYQQPNYIQSYQIHSSVPYFVPVWDNPRRIPIFFPPKPILFNPGYPARNPPGIKPTTEPSGTNPEGKLNFTIGPRINANEAGEPIWGVVEAGDVSSSSGGVPARPSSTIPPPPPLASGSGSRPTRPPPPLASGSGSRPTRPPTPPLLHRPSLSEQTNQNSGRPGLGDRDNPNVGQSTIQQFRPPVTQFRPPTTTTTTLPPPAAAPQGREEPNRCVWAIISCCNPTNNNVSYNCFERSGCPGAFWDKNPCSREVTAAAFNAAAKFYEQS